MKIRQSVCLPMFRNKGVEMPALLSAIADMGYEAVEIWGREPDFADLMRLVKDRGLIMASMCGHQGNFTKGGMNNNENRAEIVKQLRESIDLAKKHEIPGLITLSGNKFDGQDSETSLANCAAVHAEVAPYAEKAGINLNLELLNSKRNHPGYECDHTAWGVAVCQKVNSPRVKLLYDIYHMAIMEGDVIQTIRDNIGLIGHFHTAGNPGREDFDDTQELNYTGICRAIAATEYNLFVGHEFRPKGEPLAALRRAFEICSDVAVGA